jgi:membrane protein required for colicin V production
VNQIDALLLVLLAPFALRGWWRGFCRESFGLLGVIGGALAAAAGYGPLADALVGRELLPPLAAVIAAVAAIFLGVSFVASLVGAAADRVVRAVLLGGVNRAVGLGLGVLKGAAALGFLLLVCERAALSPALAEQVGASRLGRPLIHLASRVLDVGRGLAATAGHGP